MEGKKKNKSVNYFHKINYTVNCLLFYRIVIIIKLYWKGKLIERGAGGNRKSQIVAQGRRGKKADGQPGSNNTANFGGKGLHFISYNKTLYKLTQPFSFFLSFCPSIIRKSKWGF